MVGKPRIRWRDYRTAAGRRPIAEFVEALSDTDAAAVTAAMKEVALEGLAAARHVRGEIYEVRAYRDRVTYRILFATQGKRGQVLLASRLSPRRREDATRVHPARRASPGKLKVTWSSSSIAELISRIRYEKLTAEVTVMARDFLDEIIQERTKRNSEFPEMVEAALRARRLLRSLAERRRDLGLSQTAVAARMRTSQSALARLEGGEADPRISTVERYALAMGEELEHRRAVTLKISRKTRASLHPAASGRKRTGG